MSLSKRLERLLKKKLGHRIGEDWGDYISSLDEKQKKEILVNKLIGFFSSIDNILEQQEKKMRISVSSLEISNKELDLKNMELTELNTKMQHVLEGLREGLLIFDKNGICSNFYSYKCVDLFGVVPAQKHILDILRVDKDKRSAYEQWIGHFFEQILDFEDIANLGPTKLTSPNKDRVIQLDYLPVYYDYTSLLKGVLVLALDVTDRYEQEKKAKKAQEYAKMVTQTVVDWDSYISFFYLYKNFVKQLQGVASSIDELLRILHTIKGTASSLFISDIEDGVHELEDEVLMSLKTEDHGASLLAEYSKKSATVLNELIQNFFKKYETIFERYLTRVDDDSNTKKDVNKSFLELIDKEKISEETRKFFVQNFMQVSFSSLFDHLNYKIANLSQKLNKLVKLEVIGGDDIYVFPQDYQVLSEQIFHITGNCVYHGIELPGVRAELAKPEVGHIKFSIRREVGEFDERIILTIEDDGGGIKKQSLIETLKARGDTEVDEMSDHEIYQTIFLAGVSTEKEANQIAGRGIGMSSVRDTIVTMGGSIIVESDEGKGSRFIIDLPLIED